MSEESRKHKIKRLLAEFLGIETADINDEDLLRDDLHMGPVDITDFANQLTENDLDVKQEDWQNIETVEDIYDYQG